MKDSVGILNRSDHLSAPLLGYGVSVFDEVVLACVIGLGRWSLVGVQSACRKDLEPFRPARSLSGVLLRIRSWMWATGAAQDEGSSEGLVAAFGRALVE
jgi:hypothetical protein